MIKLQYLKSQTDEICLSAVKQDGWDLRFVEIKPTRFA